MVNRPYVSFSYILLLLSAISAIVALSTSGFLYKSGTASIGIIILVILEFTRAKFSKENWFVMGAFFFSISGDWFLSNMQGNSMMFVKGIALYFLAHVGYLIFAMMNGKIKLGFTGGLLATFLVYYFLVLFPSFDDQALMISALIYLLVSVLSLGAAAGIECNPAVKWTYVFGIFLILLSDTIISLKEFIGYHYFDILILPTYYMAHISITFSLIRKAESVALKQ